MIAKPDRKLIPVFNLASARLLLLARQEEAQEEQGGGGGQPAANAAQKAVEPSVVDDNQLRDIPKSRKAGIADGPDLLPSADQRIESRWTVCDQYVLNRDENQPAGDNKVETTVIAGVKELGTELPQDQSLLVQAPDGQTYLVYRTPGTANLPNTNAVRAKVDLSVDDQGRPSRREVRPALKLNNVAPRLITTGMLNAIPEKPELKAPEIPDRGDDSDIDLGSGAPDQVGSVFRVVRAGNVTEYYVLLKNGINEVKESTADLIRFRDNPGDDNDIPAVDPDQISNAPNLEEIEDSTYPETATEVLDQVNFPVACLAWSYSGSGNNAEDHTAVHIGDQLPGVPLDSAGKAQSIPISTPNADRIRIDYFYMPPGRGAVVRLTTSREDFGTGPITLVSDRGVKYGVPDAATAGALGLGDQKPAPANIVGLLPDGASLSTKDVVQSYDSSPVGPGQYPTTTPAAGGG